MLYIILFWLYNDISQAEEFKITTYNVENLFDSHDNPSKADSLYSKKKYLKKVNAICEALKGEQSDVLALVEIENKLLANIIAKKLNYKKFVITNSDDRRGINVAVLFNESNIFKFKDFSEIKLGFPTRSILKTHFSYRKKDIFIFVNHWPSQHSPTEKRIAAALKLKSAVKSAIGNSDSLAFAIGDFNSIESEQPHPLEVLKRNKLFYDLTFQQKELFYGTYFYGPQMKWSYLDRIFVAGKSSLKVLKNARTSVVRSKMALGVWESWRKSDLGYGSRVIGVPKRFASGGVSDHFALKTRINLDAL